MGAIERRNNVKWNINPGVSLSDIDNFSVEKIPTEKLYDNCIFQFRHSGTTTISLGFLIGPTSYSVTMGNGYRSAKTTTGNHLQISGNSVGNLNLSLVLIDSGEVSERLIFLDTMIKANGDYFNLQGGYQSLYGMSIKIEGVQYFGYCTSFSFQKDSSNVFIYHANVNFEFFNFVLDDPSISSGKVLKRNGFDYIDKIENCSFELSDSSKTDEDSLITDSTMKDTVTEGLSEVSKMEMIENGIAKTKVYSFDTGGGISDKDKYVKDLKGTVYLELGDVVQIQKLKNIPQLGPFVNKWSQSLGEDFFVAVPKQYLKSDGGVIDQSSSIYYFVCSSYLTNIEDREYDEKKNYSIEDDALQISDSE